MNRLRVPAALIVFVLLISPFTVQSQTPDSVDVTFYYQPSGNPSQVYLPGEFNNWSLTSIALMSKNPQTGVWSKTVRLRIGGPATGALKPGTYEYKFNENGTTWLSDPLNPRTDPNNYNNSYLYITDPTIHYLLPNSTQASGEVRTRFPEITAYIFPSTSSEVDTASIVVKIDSMEYQNMGGNYDPVSRQLRFTPPIPLGDGTHSLALYANSTTGGSGADSTTFLVRANIAQILTLPAQTYQNQWRIQGAFFDVNGGFDTSVTSAQISRNDTSWTVSVVEGRVDTTFSLVEGPNEFRLQAVINNQLQVSEPVVITRIVNHSPTAVIRILLAGNSVEINGVNSFDPDSQAVTYFWDEDLDNPEPLGISGITAGTITIPTPATDGEYFVRLKVTDPDGNLDSTRNYFTVAQSGSSIDTAGYADNPSWVKNGRVYQLFFKAFTPEGTIRAAIPNLPYIQAMGFNIIWVLPVMEVPGNIDNQTNIGYNIMDFMKIEESYGTEQDFKDFIQAAHDLGIKVILDVTPNHTSNQHPFAQEAKRYQDFSQYWNYYQTQFIPHNDYGFGQCSTPEGIYYYCPFSDVLLNYNWSDLDARQYMTNVYTYWVNSFDIDGFRFDVYWGPSRRYGEQAMGIPVRRAVKHFKPDVLLFGETDGVGVGTEVVYADYGGGLDMANDWILYFSSIRYFGFTSADVNNLHNNLENNGFYPGENSYFARFLENHDEDRIAYIYNSFERTMPMATAIFTAPGIPFLYNGQEVGFGKDMGNPGEPDLNDRRRGIIDWNFAGKELLTPHYQKLAQIRAQFPAFSQHRQDTNGDGQVTNSDDSDFNRLNTGNGLVYAFIRPYLDQNGVTVVNFSTDSQTGTMNLVPAGLKISGDFDPADTYWVNNLYADTSYQVPGTELTNFTVTLPPFGSAVFVIGKEEMHVNLPPLPPLVSIDGKQQPPVSTFRLAQNYPNPFNPQTTIEFTVPRMEQVKLNVYNILGQRVRELTNRTYRPGTYRIVWDGFSESGTAVASGIYILEMRAGAFRQTRKMLLVK